MHVEEQRQNRDSLICEYDELVQQIARTLMKRFALASSLYEELISAGYLALVEAAENSADEDRNLTFKAYASIRIRGAMIDMLRNTSVLSRKSHRFVKAMHALQYMREEDLLEKSLLHDRGRKPSEKLGQILDLAGKGALAFQLSSGEARDEVEAVADSAMLPDEQLDRSRKRAYLERLINQLPEKEQIIVRQYYFNDKAFVTIANENAGMNKSWVSKLHVRALEHLRDLINENPL